MQSFLYLRSLQQTAKITDLRTTTSQWAGLQRLKEVFG
jgi:hypothetical protein